MKRLLGAALVAALFLPAAAQPSRSPAAKEDAAATSSEPKVYLLDVSEARAKTGRVPNGYGKIGLTRDQKERIYGIQAAYAARVKELEAELAKLKGEQIEQIKNVLDDGQRAQIDKYEAQFSSRRAAGN